jgi:hypothetical protein
MYAQQLIMVDLSFVTSDSVIQKGVAFLMIPAQRVVAGVQTIKAVPFHELFQKLSCTDPVRERCIVDITGSFMNNLQLVAHLLSCHAPVDLFIALSATDLSRCFVSDNYVATFELITTLASALLLQNTFAILC